ncbi:MAG TPA: metalloregulator ArsR/SmtB family transcription factor [Acidimicrobiales bacterium]|nr:metalloregulator ArsR/SmtB family transcription factor [Acidimicrobiales bacterium]
MPNKAQPGPQANGHEPEMQRVIAALNSPIRREILALIWDHDVPAGEIAAAFSVTKPTISQHLGVLRQAGLVTSTASGTSRLYRARPEALRGLNAALTDPGKWLTADDLPERELSVARTTAAVIVSTEVPTDQAATFRAFADPAVYSRWLGVPVSIVDGRFACTMEWGTTVRGRYEVVSPPDLIAMRWDFEDNNIPVPGGEMTAYLRLRPAPGGTHVEVQQLVDTQEQADFMEVAWSLVLGRLTAGIVAALDPESSVPPRPSRRKRRGNTPPEPT